MKYLLSAIILILTYLVYRHFKKKARERENNLVVIHTNSRLSKFFKMITDHFLEVYADGLFLPGHAQTFLLELFDFILKILRKFSFFAFKFYKKEIFELSDGGSITIDHAGFKDEKMYNGEVLSKKKRILVVIPGYTSNSDEYYIKNFINEFVEEFDCKVMNARGFGGKLTSPHMISTQCYKDVREYLEFICDANPNKSVYAVGFSFGGMLLARCLGRDPETLPKNLLGGCGICYPMCLEATKNHVEPQLYGLYSKYAAKNLKKVFFDNVNIFFTENKNIFTREEMLIKMSNMNRVCEFDEIFTYKSLNFESCEEYYKDSRIDKFIQNIQLPFLSIFTKDDPIIPYEAIPLDIFEKNKNLVTVVSKKGGHMGFFTGIIPERWIDIPIKTFMKTVEIMHDMDEVDYGQAREGKNFRKPENCEEEILL